MRYQVSAVLFRFLEYPHCKQGLQYPQISWHDSMRYQVKPSAVKAFFYCPVCGILSAPTIGTVDAGIFSIGADDLPAPFKFRYQHLKFFTFRPKQITASAASGSVRINLIHPGAFWAYPLLWTFFCFGCYNFLGSYHFPISPL